MELDTTKSGPAGIGLMVGQTVTGIKVGEDTATITTDKGEWRFFHHQDCCESVTITDVSIPPEEMVGRVVSFASEEIKGSLLGCVSCTETTHTIVAEGRTLTVWWRGESNGYYSESVDVRFTPYAVETETATAMEDFLNTPVVHTLAHHRALLERLREKGRPVDEDLAKVKVQELEEQVRKAEADVSETEGLIFDYEAELEDRKAHLAVLLHELGHAKAELGATQESVLSKVAGDLALNKAILSAGGEVAS